MSKIDVITIDGNKRNCFNLHYTVGIAAINDSDDVMLIQAIFQYIKFNNHSAPFSRAIQEKDLPGINGKFDLKTANAIQIYQKANKRILLKADGIIEPGKYQNRNIVLKHYRVMIIMALDIDCQNVSVSYGGDHTEGIKSRFPQLFLMKN